MWPSVTNLWSQSVDLSRCEFAWALDCYRSGIFMQKSRKGKHLKISQKIREALGQTSLKYTEELKNFISVIYRGTKKLSYRVLFCHFWKGLRKEEQRKSFIGGYLVTSGKVWEKSVGLWGIYDLKQGNSLQILDID